MIPEYLPPTDPFAPPPADPFAAPPEAPFDEPISDAPPPAPPAADLTPSYSRGQSTPLAFEGEELLDFQKVVRNAFEAARNAKIQIDANASELRKYLSMQQVREARLANGAPAPDGTPNYVTPLAASKIHGLAATAEQILFKPSPIFSAHAHTGPGARKARSREAALEYALQRTGTRDQLRLAAAWEVFQVHAGVMDLDVMEDEDFPGEWRVVGKAVPIEDFYLWPTNCMTIDKYTSTFRRLRMTAGYMREMVEKGYYDQDAVDGTIMQRQPTNSVGETIAEVSTNSMSLTGTDLEVVEYFRFWMRHKGQLYTGYYCYDSDHILRVEPNPHNFEITYNGGTISFKLDRPPQSIMQGIPLIDSAFSLPPAQFIKEYQAINDDLFNAMMTELQYTGQFIGITNDAGLVNNFKDGIKPGIYLADRPPSQDNLRIVQNQLNPSILQGMQMVQQQAQEAVPSQPSNPPGTRQVRDAVQIFAQSSSARLSSMITNLTVGMTDMADIYWKLHRAYNISDITPVYAGSLGGRPSEVMLLGPEDMSFKIPDLEATEERKEAIVNMVRSLGMPEQLGFDMADGMPPEMDTLRIHSAYSNDLSWKVTGTQTVPERAQRIQALQAALQTVPLLSAISPQTLPRSLWKLLDKFYDALEIPDGRDILGEMPDNLNPADAALVTQTLQGMLGYNRYAIMGDSATPQVPQ